jgi:hypothetical protein
MAATAPALWGVREKLGEAAVARSTKRRPEGESRTCSGAGERVEAGRERGAAGHEHAEAGAVFDQVGHLGRHPEQMLQVVQNEQEPLVLQEGADGLPRRPVLRLPQA